ncbi:DUF1990 domain-containing protein [soil metagenome]
MGERTLLDDARSRRALDELHHKDVNFDVRGRGEFTRENGWHIDDLCRRLPPEAPGPPQPGGSWEVARDLVHNYEFADPSIIRAIYYPDRPLEQRDMLLEGRFFGLRFLFGCRVGGVIDGLRTIDGRQVQVWGWNYRTLQDHLEMGQMDYEVWKWLDSGQVEFRIHAFSKAAHISNPIVRLGFWLFGRAMQVRFARRACARMAQLTSAGLAQRSASGASETVPRASRNVIVAPTDVDPKIKRRSARRLGDDDSTG